jgi:hypothetical protein
MLEFSLGYPVPITEFRASITNSDGQKEGVEIFFSQSSRAAEKIGNPHHDMLFSFCGRSDDEIKKLIVQWIGFYNANQLTIDAIINSGVIGFGDKIPEQSFFFLIGSLEALQRKYGNLKTAMPNKKFKYIKNLIVNCLSDDPDDEDFKYIHDGVGRLNEPRLSQRLVDVLDVLPRGVSERIIDKQVLISNFIKTRTLVAHQIDRRKRCNNILFSWHVTQVLWGITVVYVLLSLGFSDEEVDSIIKNKIAMLNALHWLEEVSNQATKL